MDKRFGQKQIFGQDKDSDRNTIQRRTNPAPTNTAAIKGFDNATAITMVVKILLSFSLIPKAPKNNGNTEDLRTLSSSYLWSQLHGPSLSFNQITYHYKSERKQTNSQNPHGDNPMPAFHMKIYNTLTPKIKTTNSSKTFHRSTRFQFLKTG